MKTLRILPFGFAFGVSVSCFGAAQTLYVSTNDIHSVEGSDLGWGTYVTDDGVAHDAYTNLQYVIQLCNDKGWGGSTIWVEDGFVVSEGVQIVGGRNYRIACIGWNERLTFRSRSGDWRTGAEIRGDGTTSCISDYGSDVFIGFRILNGTAETGNGGGSNPRAASYAASFVNCLIANCTAAGSGGGCANPIALDNCVFSNNTCLAGNGGGAFRVGRHANDCLFVGNRANGTAWNNGNGGGIYDVPAITNCVFDDCHAFNLGQIDHASRVAGNGGGASTCKDVVDCVFSNCTAAAGGGAVDMCAGRNITIGRCLAGRGGGGIHSGTWYGGTVADCVCTNHTSSGSGANGSRDGGGVAMLTLGYGLTVTGCVTMAYGGGAYRSVLDRCVIVGNVVSNTTVYGAGSGGGLYGGSATNCQILSNVARGLEDKKGDLAHGAGGGASSTELYDCIVSNNTGWARGGGVVRGLAWNCVIVDNLSYAGGGGGAEVPSVYNTLVARNSAHSCCGLFYYDVKNADVVNCTVVANTNSNSASEAVALCNLSNSVVWGNKIGSSARNVHASVTTDHSCYPEATEGENGNTACDPKLRTVDGKAYAATSVRCKGKGLEYGWMTDPADVRSQDWYGDPRILGDGPDMGWVSLKKMGMMLLLR